MEGKKKALFYSNQGISVTGTGVELEVANQLIEQGWFIYSLVCDSCFDGCFYNPMHNLLACSICAARTTEYYPLIGEKGKDYIQQKMKRWPEVETFKVPFFKDNQELISYTYDGIDLGRGVLSSIVSIMRDNAVSSEKYPELIDAQLKTALTALKNIQHYIQVVQPDHVYLFNGRFADVYPVVAYCQQIDLPFTCLETERSNRKYDIYVNDLPHSIRLRQEKIERLWQDENIPQLEKEQKANDWFQRKRKGQAVNVKNFIGQQEKGSLPANFDPAKLNVAIFNSSEDEMVAIREWKNTLINNQNDGIRWLVHACRDQPAIHFYLRVHPNLEGVDSEQVRGIQAMDYPNLTVIPADDPIDTYALMDAVNKVVSFGSTTGIEATYWGKPSILVGRAIYDHADCVYKPTSKDQLLQWILDADLPPKPQSATFLFAYYVKNRGIPFQWFQWKGKWNSTFKGKLIRRIMPATFGFLLRYLKDLPLWIRGNKMIRGRFPTWRDAFNLHDRESLPTFIDE